MIDGRINHAFFVEFLFVTKTVRVWQGFRALDLSARRWMPVGPQATVRDVEDPVGNTSPALSLNISGVDPSLLALALSESDEVQGRFANIYDQYFDTDWQPYGDFAFFSVVRMDTLKVSKKLDSGSGEYTQAIDISAEQFLTNGPNPPFGRYTNADQWAREGNTDDLYFEYMGANQNRRQRWPTF